MLEVTDALIQLREIHRKGNQVNEGVKKLGRCGGRQSTGVYCGILEQTQVPPSGNIFHYSGGAV